mgnify:FL=1
MIDEKKIEEAARQHMIKEYCNNGDWSFPCKTADIKSQCEDDFKSGACWAIQEFLKDLWHDIRQERIPKKGFFLIEMAIEGRIFYVSKRLPAEESNLSSYLRQGCARRWSNLEDLLKHEEGDEK